MDQQGFYVDSSQQQQQHGGFQQAPMQQPFPQQQQQQHMQPPPMAPPGSAQPQPPPITNPFDPSSLQGPLMTSAVSYAAQQHLGNVSQRVQGMVNVNQLKYYFDVDNKYVALKLQLLLFPYLQKSWERGIKDDKAMTPREDKRSPDLYIPSMALVTYILLVSWVQGATGNFNAEQLSLLCSSTIGLLVFENLAAKLASFVLGVQAPLYDIMAFTSYKFVSVIVAILATVISRSATVYYLACGWVAAALFYFTFRSLAASTASKKGSVFAVGVAGVQVLLAFLLSTSGLAIIPTEVDATEAA
ncbi:hypothetical protein PTSG_03565 [Salpingoeca rosetta]|uniref:Protein YIF1 n=1 Tax=Salpingoeca rosetta (strain ATCC 50818 / BSB-021) TaxID=946362 RepID=F2U5Z1_SALR5|nr:uncharacterized protein PTSG_03565 [Salpingoeca rosetta]EGD82932.1 hypothetical protein PTSG_03565 [Salpingoeca rosetta]|eukprot:XP_004995296.1 hypothetical protein PTSG_03565 [Salpingoeca rosetta]